MPLQKQIIPVRFAGLDGKTDPKASPPGRLSLLENAYAARRTDGAFELRKRNGGTSLTRDIAGGGTFTAGQQIGVRGADLCVDDGKLLYSYNGPIVNNWTKRGKVQNIAATLDRVQGGGAPGTTDIAYAEVDASQRISVMVTHEGLGGSLVTYYVFDETTGGNLIARGTFSGKEPRLAVLGSTVYIFYYNSANTIHRRSIVASTPTTLSGETTVITNIHATVRNFDVRTIGSNVVLAYKHSNNTDVAWLDAIAGTGAGNTTRNASGAVGILDSSGADGKWYIACATTTGAVGVRLLQVTASTGALDSDTAIDTAVTTARNVTGYAQDSTHRGVFYEIPGASNEKNRVAGWYETGTFMLMRGVGLVGRMWHLGSTTTHYYVIVCQEGAAQRNLYLLEYEHALFGGTGGISVAGYLMAGNARGVSIDPSTIGGAAHYSTTKVYVSHAGKEADGTITANKIALDFTGAGLGAPVEFAGVLHVPGACPKVFDGQSTGENGFMNYPEPLTAVSAAGAGMVLGGAYQWCVTEKRTYRDGRIVRSAPSAITSLTLTAGQGQANLTIPTARITEWAVRYNVDTSVVASVLELWRTKDGAANFYNVTSIANDVAADTVAYTDSMSDTTLGARELLYTATGAVDHIFPPMTVAMAVHQNRLWAACGDGTLWISKELRDGFGAQFSDALRLQFDPSNGPFTGLVALDTAMTVHFRNAVYAIAGAGPDDTGVGLYDVPVPLLAPAGATGPKRLGLTPDGIVYQSAKGIFMVTRGLEVQPVEGVDQYNSLNVTGAVAEDGTTLIVFPTSDGRSLVWDWQLKTWATWTNQAAVGAVRWNNQLCLLQSDGRVRREIAAQYNDDGSAIDMKAEVTWLNLWRFRAYRALVVGEAMASCTLIGTTAWDFDSATAASKSLALTTASKWPSAFVSTRSRGGALQLTLRENSTTEGVRLSVIGLEVGAKPGGAEKLPTARYAT